MGPASLIELVLGLALLFLWSYCIKYQLFNAHCLLLSPFNESPAQKAFIPSDVDLVFKLIHLDVQKLDTTVISFLSLTINYGPLTF